jgi:hypothetical protein
MEPEAEKEHPLSHDYQDDLARVMNATDARVVQGLLADAREREAAEAEAVVEGKERKWYGVSSLILVVLTLSILGYGAYYYMNLTVPLQPAISVGVFQSTANIPVNATSIADVLALVSTDATLPPNKPVLINLVTDSASNTLLSNSQLYAFIGATLSEPLQSVISTARLGMINNGKEAYPFIVASVADPEKASKEFGIAEQTLLPSFYQALGLSIAGYDLGTPHPFESQYFYNLPVRTLSVTNPDTQEKTSVFLYGYVSNNIIVISAKPEALKAVYDTIISQQ